MTASKITVMIGDQPLESTVFVPTKDLSAIQLRFGNFYIDLDPEAARTIAKRMLALADKLDGK